MFDLLEFLIRNRDRVMSRDDLIAGLWGGRIVSESTLATRINAACKAVGDDGNAQRLIRTIARKGFRLVGEVREDDGGASEPARDSAGAVNQAIGFCRASDDVGIAMAVAGAGPVLFKAVNWLNHIEYDWQSPIWSPMFARLAGRFRLVRYDGHGNGLSDRDVADISFARFEREIEQYRSLRAAAKFCPNSAARKGKPNEGRKTSMLRLSALAALAAVALSATSVSAQSGRLQVGVLECRGGESISFVVGSVTELSCVYRPDMGPPQAYRATVHRAGIDIGVTAVSGLIWGVLAPTREIGLGDISGNYAGFTAGAAVGVGLGANALVGGSNNSIALQPLSVEGQAGLNVFAGVAGLELRFGR